VISRVDRPSSTILGRSLAKGQTKSLSTSRTPHIWKSEISVEWPTLGPLGAVQGNDWMNLAGEVSRVQASRFLLTGDGGGDQPRSKAGG
jgi:hypothetical protein